jgi:ABC-2 type transport system ATP-binding protein
MNNDKAQPAGAAAVKVSNLVKRFGALKAVDDISFEVRQGEIFGFLGPNGAGKTTTINMICGLLEPDEGEILFFGNQALRKNDIKTRIGICPQENIIWPQLTCFEQLAFMGEMYGIDWKAARNRAGELLAWMDLEKKAHTVAAVLSGGMKRRLNLCLGLVHDPGLLILDEPEAGLDPQGRVLVRNFIKKLAKEKTIILTTHNMDEADRLSDRAAIIDYGKLLLVDTPHNLKKTVGEGDILEITLEKNEDASMQLLAQRLLEICHRVNVSGETLIVRSGNLIQSVAEITGRIERQGFKINEMTMRQNTLEDVFIHLTGRTLRQ